MQPAQLSLLAEQLPAPEPRGLAELDQEGVNEAIGLLGALIARASTTSDPPEGTAIPMEAQTGD